MSDLAISRWGLARRHWVHDHIHYHENHGKEQAAQDAELEPLLDLAWVRDVPTVLDAVRACGEDRDDEDDPGNGGERVHVDCSGVCGRRWPDGRWFKKLLNWHPLLL